MEWRWYEALGSRPYPHRSDDELIQWVVEDLPLDSPPEEFVTDGQLHTFSTLSPAPPPEGSLRLVAVREWHLHVAVFVIVLALGLLLVFRPFRHKLAGMAALAALLLALGVFFPTFSRQIMDGALLSAVLIVAVGWLGWHMLRAWPYVVVAFSRRRSANTASEDQSAESGPESESPAQASSSGESKDESGDTGESDEEGEPEDANPDDASNRETTDDQQEGGRDDA